MGPTGCGCGGSFTFMDVFHFARLHILSSDQWIENKYDARAIVRKQRDRILKLFL